MSDDRLFASNSAIGRKWYFLNLIILAVISVVTGYIFNNFIIPNVTSDFYALISNCILYFAYLIYSITLLALLDRRLYDIFGERDTKGYKFLSSIIWLFVLAVIFSAYCQYKNPVLSFPVEYVYTLTFVLSVLFILILLLAGFFKGKISNPSYNKYK